MARHPDRPVRPSTAARARVRLHDVPQAGAAAPDARRLRQARPARPRSEPASLDRGRLTAGAAVEGVAANGIRLGGVGRLVRILPAHAGHREDVRLGRSAGGDREPLGVTSLRLFFGRRTFFDITSGGHDGGRNLMRLSAASQHDVRVRKSRWRVAPPRRLSGDPRSHWRAEHLDDFDPINFAKASVDPAAALARLPAVSGSRPLERAGKGAVLRVRERARRSRALVEALLSGGYAGTFTVEDQGRSGRSDSTASEQREIEDLLEETIT